MTDVICPVEDGKTTFFLWSVGRCYCQVADGIPPGWRIGRCYSQVADGIATVPMLFFSSGMLNRTSSHMCGRWYLPTFLFRDGSLSLMYMASFMALIRFWSSFPTILQFSILMVWPVDVIVVIYGGWGLLMFLQPFTKSSGRLTNVLFITLHPITFILVDDTTSFQLWILIFGCHQEAFDGDTSLEVHLYL